MFTVVIDNLQVYAFHGVPDAEREIGHRYEIDLAMEIDGKADKSDEVKDTVDYAEAAKIAEQIVKEKQFRTIERLANEIGQTIMKRFPKIDEIEVSVRKPNPPAPVIADAFGVTLVVRR